MWRGADANDDQMHWNAAVRILQKIGPRLVMTWLSRKQRFEAWLRFKLGNLGIRNPIDAWLNQHKRNSSEVSAGVAVPLKEKHGEDRAFEIQVRVLEYAIQLRKQVYGGRKLTLGDLPQDQDQESKNTRAKVVAKGAKTAALAGAGATVRDFVARIQEDTIPSEAQKDIVADYRNKLAFISWEKAKLEKERGDGPWLRQARKYIDIALKGRPTWTPAQLNLARITAAEGNTQEALKILERVLGKKRESVQVPVVAPALSSDAITDMILKMDVERSLGDIAQRIIRKVTEERERKVTQLEYHNLYWRRRATQFKHHRKSTSAPDKKSLVENEGGDQKRERGEQT